MIWVLDVSLVRLLILLSRRTLPCDVSNILESVCDDAFSFLFFHFPDLSCYSAGISTPGLVTVVSEPLRDARVDVLGIRETFDMEAPLCCQLSSWEGARSTP